MMTKKKADAAAGAGEPGILLTVDVAAQLDPSVELAVAMAGALRSPLHGLFIEDEGLLNAAGLPFSLEFHGLGGKPRKFDPADLQRSMTRLAAEFRAALERHADLLALSWSYQTCRGSKRAATLADDLPARLLIVAQPRGRRRRVQQRRRILFYPHQEEAALTALAELLTACADHPLEVLVVHADAEAGSLSPELLELLQQHPGATQRSLSAEQAAQLLVNAEQGPDYVMLSRQANREIMEQCLLYASCPLIIVP